MSIPTDRLTRAQVKFLRNGKVRDLYAWRDEIWLVASDRISAYDVIMPTPIPDKGKILTALSRHWFALTENICPNHVAGFDLPAGVDLPEFEGRLTRAKRCTIFPVECVARGHLAGSGWEEYRAHGTVGGHAVPKGLLESDRLPQPLFTPARKNDHGHDENLTEAEARVVLGDERYEELRDLTLDLYTWAAAYANDDIGKFNAQTFEAVGSLRAVAPQFYPSADTLRFEHTYMVVDPFMWAWIIYFCALLVLLLTVIWARDWGYYATWALTLIGMSLEIYGFASRIIISGRPPVTDLYETVIWVSFIGMVFAIILEAVYRKRYFFYAGLPAAGPR